VDLFIGSRRFTIGTLVQCNTDDHQDLLIAGVPVGREVPRRWLPCFDPLLSPSNKHPKCVDDGADRKAPPDHGSIIIVVASDAPLIPTQLNRVAKRAAMGLARLGSYAGDYSGDLIVTFLTNAAVVNDPDQTAPPSPIAQIASADMDKLFEGTVQATEEAIVNALIAAQTMTGVNGYREFGLPHDELRAILKRYNRLRSSY
jgi:D-aminopeptidase